MKKQPLIFSADFETTVYDGQSNTQVWVAACVPLYTEDVQIFHSIDEQFEYFASFKKPVIAYYHNLKFDGAFWLSYFLITKGFAQAYTPIDDNGNVEWKDDKSMRNKEVKYSISAKGQWYTIKVKINSVIIEIRDSLKLLPFSVKKLAKGFKTKHKKLEMEYKGLRYPGCEITESEKEYISSDVLVVKEALEFMFDEGHRNLTIGSCCLSEYKKDFSVKGAYEAKFPDLYKMDINPLIYGSKSVGEYLHRSYKGGWCYLVKGKENRVYHKGTTADVNSLYPSVMHSDSGNYYPVGWPHMFHGQEAVIAELKKFDFYNNRGNPCEALGKFYFIRLRTRFELKPNKLPCIQIKGDNNYNPTEWLTTSNIYRNGEWYSSYVEAETGIEREATVTLTLTQTDLALIREHYTLYDTEWLDGCWFTAEKGIFDPYINKYRDMKVVSTGAMRELAKLFLNNLYGKMASSPDSSFKVAIVKPDGSLGFRIVLEEHKKPGYIAIGSAITSYARNFTIRAAQLNYHGVNKAGFIYADTDSIHCDLKPEKLRGIKVDNAKFCHWKLETCWDEAIFTRQKTYIEHVTHENCQPIDSPYYNVKCAGMPDKCKDLFVRSLEHYIIKPEDTFTEREREIIERHYSLADFKVGLTLPGKLLPKQIPGGVLLVETDYKMRNIVVG